MLETRKITLAGSQPNDPILTNMFIFQENPHIKNGLFNNIHGIDRLSVNDCFLRNMQRYKYIANIDIDEIIIPQNMTNWLEMMEFVEKLSDNKVYSNYLSLTAYVSSSYEFDSPFEDKHIRGVQQTMEKVFKIYC